MEENAVSEADKKAENATNTTSATQSVILLPSSIKREITLNFLFFRFGCRPALASPFGRGGIASAMTERASQCALL